MSVVVIAYTLGHAQPVACFNAVRHEKVADITGMCKANDAVGSQNIKTKSIHHEAIHKIETNPNCTRYRKKATGQNYIYVF